MSLRFGIIGCGVISARFAEALKLSKSGVLHAVSARELVRAEKFAKEHGAEKAYADYESLIEDENIDAVYIGLIHTEHYRVARLCVERGKAVLCEKPFFVNSKEANELKTFAEEKRVLIMEAMWTRTMPAFQTAKKWIQDGKIGKVKIIQANFCSIYPFNEQTRNLRLWNPKLGGGALLDVGVYPYEYMTGLLDEYPDRFEGVVHESETGVDASVAFTMHFKSGVIGVGMASLDARMSEDAVISGSDGYIIQYDFFRTTKCERFNNRNELVECFEEPVQDGFIYEIEHFVKLYQSGQLYSPIITMDDCIDFITHAEVLLKELSGEEQGSNATAK